MTNPVTYQVLDAIQTRLEAITVANGYNTNAGNQVHLGMRKANPDDVDTGPVLNIYDTSDEADETTGWGAEPIHTTMRINVDSFIRYVDAEVTLTAHLLFQDIFNATLNVADRTLSGLALDFGYSGRTVEYPEPGGDTVSVSVEFTCLIQMPYGVI